MRTDEYSELYKLETFYWWFVARRKLLASTLKAIVKPTGDAQMLDIGCGTGINFSTLSRFGKVFSVDSSQEAMKFSRMRGVDPLVLSGTETLAFATETFDVITILDVLEHIDDDLAALGEIHRVTKSGGLLVITVPAYGFLWSEHDEALHHRRRYAASELRNKLTRAGLEVERVSYYICFLFFPILIVRFLQSIFKKSIHPKTSHVILPEWINSFLIFILDCERYFLKWINFPFGVSLICVARKRP